jgi:hypothetical protein
MAGHQPATYNIFCLVFGSTSPFKVNIAENSSISDLKDAIKEKNANAFANIDAPELTLYLINIRADTELSKNVNERIKTITPAEALNPTDELSDLFSEAPAKKTVHILVQTRK